ncbi:MAG: hypothetical protein ACEPOW_10790 [Bacteroidales bacterium]
MKSVKMQEKISLNKERVSHLKLEASNGKNKSGDGCLIALSIFGTIAGCVASVHINGCTH